MAICRKSMILDTKRPPEIYQALGRRQKNGFCEDSVLKLGGVVAGGVGISANQVI